MNTKQILAEAIETGEILNVRYHSGSQPGTIRKISPETILSDSKVRAYCYASEQSKFFKIDDLEVIDEPCDGRQYDPNWVRHEPEHLRDALGKDLDRLIALGWHLEIDESHCALYRVENGVPSKDEIVSIKFQEHPSRPTYSAAIVFEFTEDGISAHTESGIERSEKPWVVRWNDGSRHGTPYKYLSTAAKRFVKLGTELAG